MRAEFYNLYLRQRNCYPKRAWQLGSAKTVHCITIQACIWGPSERHGDCWKQKISGVLTLDTTYEKRIISAAAWGMPQKFECYYPALQKPCMSWRQFHAMQNASDSIIPNDLRIWSNNFSFPHLFWESKLRTQDWTLAITQGGQEPHSFDVLHLLRIQFFVEDICKRVPAVTSALGKLK